MQKNMQLNRQRLVDRFCQSGNGENEEFFVSLVGRVRGRMLDLGCNDGSFTIGVAKRAKTKEIYGVEIDRRYIKLARQKGIKVKKHDLNQPLPYKDSWFDLVTANQVIEHLYFTDDFTREIHRVLKPGGQLVISTTNLAAWHYRVQLLLGQQPICLHPSERQFGNWLKGGTNPRYGHKSVFTNQALKQFLEFHGFRVEQAKTVRFYPFGGEISRGLLTVFANLGAFTTVSAVKV